MQVYLISVLILAYLPTLLTTGHYTDFCCLYFSVFYHDITVTPYRYCTYGICLTLRTQDITWSIISTYQSMAPVIQNTIFLQKNNPNQLLINQVIQNCKPYPLLFIRIHPCVYDPVRSLRTGIIGPKIFPVEKISWYFTHIGKIHPRNW